MGDFMNALQTEKKDTNEADNFVSDRRAISGKLILQNVTVRVVAYFADLATSALRSRTPFLQTRYCLKQKSRRSLRSPASQHALIIVCMFRTCSAIIFDRIVELWSSAFQCTPIASLSIRPHLILLLRNCHILLAE